MKLVIDSKSGGVLGATNDPTFAATPEQILFDAPAEFLKEQASKWSFDGTTMVYDATAAAERALAALSTPYMSHFGFLGRFTSQQRLAIRALIDKTSAEYNPILDDAMFLFNAAERIDVTLPMTQELVGYLANIDLVTAEQVPPLLAPILRTDVSARP